jgi:hypothetical protein
MGKVIDLTIERRKRRLVHVVRREAVSTAATPPTREQRANTPYTISWDDNDGTPVHPTDCPHSCTFVGSCIERDCPIWHDR